MSDANKSRKRHVSFSNIGNRLIAFKRILREQDSCRLPKIIVYLFAPEFISNKNTWGLGYALNKAYVQLLPPSPLFKRHVKSKLSCNPRLQLGCGSTICPGWVHQDRRHRKGVDLVVDARRMKKYVAFNSLDAVFTSHMLEHLPRHEAKALLADFWNWLHPGGELWIAVPDLTALYEIASDPCTSTEEREKALMLIATPKPGHVSAWFFEDLREILRSLGFDSISKWEKPPDEFEKTNGCWTHQIRAKPISLNVYARKKQCTEKYTNCESISQEGP
jgi:hypothetical protein